LKTLTNLFWSYVDSNLFTKTGAFLAISALVLMLSTANLVRDQSSADSEDRLYRSINAHIFRWGWITFIVGVLGFLIGLLRR
jgi:uncharacterized membrane protein YfcA